MNKGNIVELKVLSYEVKKNLEKGIKNDFIGYRVARKIDGEYKLVILNFSMKAKEISGELEAGKYFVVEVDTNDVFADRRFKDGRVVVHGEYKATEANEEVIDFLEGLNGFDKKESELEF